MVRTNNLSLNEKKERERFSGLIESDSKVPQPTGILSAWELQVFFFFFSEVGLPVLYVGMKTINNLNPTH